jgi:hypothetical protein
MAIGVAFLQLVPLPTAVLRRLASHSAAANGLGHHLAEAATDSSNAELATEAAARIPVTVNRSATLRWLAGAAACFVLFCVAAHYADRFGRTMVVWGSVIGSVFLCAVIGMVQIVGGLAGLYGFLEVGKGPDWSPSVSDVTSAPSVTVLRSPLAQGEAAGWALKLPDAPAAIGGLMGGPGAFLALGSLGLPLAVGVALQLMAPRGSRDRLWHRLMLSGRLGLVVVVVLLSILTAALVGFLGGLILCLPFALGVVVAGLPGARAAGVRGVAWAVVVSVVVALGAGVGVGRLAAAPRGSSPLAETARWAVVREVWTGTARIARDFPLTGSGLGSFATIYPYYKQRDEASTTALSSLLQWWAEAGLAGVAILVAAVVWGLVKLPAALRAVASADRVMPFALLGTMACFAVFSVLHWSIELTAVALAASAIGGTLNRWLAGGTDLLVEHA